MKYLVRWEVELEADSPIQAATTAFDGLTDGNRNCQIIHVQDENNVCNTVNVFESESNAVKPLGFEEFYTANFSLNQLP